MSEEDKKEDDEEEEEEIPLKIKGKKKAESASATPKRKRISEKKNLKSQNLRGKEPVSNGKRKPKGKFPMWAGKNSFMC